MNDRRIRIGIDVGGTFTKAVAINITTGEILSASTVPTTHTAERGVSVGIVAVLSNLLKESDIKLDEIEIIAHSTTQAINALLESDTSKVGILAMGVGPEKKSIIKRTNLNDAKINFDNDIKATHRFLDTSHLITDSEVSTAVQELKNDGAKVIVATEAFGVDDPSNEEFVMEHATKLELPSTGSHEISGIYGLEIRTLTAAINASVLPKTVQVGKFVEEAIQETGVTAPLMIMKGDGGVTSMDTFRTKPILTVLSGPAASVAGALLYLKVTNGIFVEVGGTSTNICIIKNGKPEIRYVTIKTHPTCIRSMDVRVLGVAGGSMIKVESDHIVGVGPRSAHIAGMKYSCYVDADELSTGEIIFVKPKKSDISEYVAIKCKNGTYAITNTCAANSLGLINEGDYSYSNQESAKLALNILGKKLSITGIQAATIILQTASFDITKEITKIIKEFKLDHSKVKLIGGGGGASVLVPFVAKQLNLNYAKADYAEVISSIGVASSMMQEQLEESVTKPNPEQISKLQKKIHDLMVEKGSTPESVSIDTLFIPEKSILRVTAIGNVELDNSLTAKNVFSEEEALERASEISIIPKEKINIVFQTEHYFAFVAKIQTKKLMIKKNLQSVIVIDKYGRQKLSLKNATIIDGKSDEIITKLDKHLSSKGDISPQVYLLNELKLIDFSGLTSKSHILDAVKKEMETTSNTCVIIEQK
tara:strand:- start:209 stop:2326 length:2118 start_codon:yes stop_codon:yes gene_type:complete